MDPLEPDATSTRGPGAARVTEADPPPAPGPRVRDREVVLVTAAVVVCVLAINVVSGLVAPLDQLLAFAPVIVVGMVAVTVVVLYRSVRRNSRR